MLNLKYFKGILLALLVFAIGFIIIKQDMPDLWKVQAKVIQTSEIPTLLRNLLPKQPANDVVERKLKQTPTQIGHQIQDLEINRIKMAVSLAALRTSTKSISEASKVTPKNPIAGTIHYNITNIEVKNADIGKEDEKVPEGTEEEEKEDTKRTDSERENNQQIESGKQGIKKAGIENEELKRTDKEQHYIGKQGTKSTGIENEEFKRIDKGQVVQNDNIGKQETKSTGRENEEFKRIDKGQVVQNNDIGKQETKSTRYSKKNEEFKRDKVVQNNDIRKQESKSTDEEKEKMKSITTKTENIRNNGTVTVMIEIKEEIIHGTPKATTVPTTTTLPPPNTTTTQPPYRVQSLKELKRPNAIRYNYNGHWQMQTDYFEIYLYRAYYDDRITLKTNPAVRVIGMSECAENRTLHCLFWFKGQDHPEMGNVTLGRIGNGVPRHGLLFREYILSCPLPNRTIGQFQPPEHVSLITADYMLPTNLLPVIIPAKPAKKLEFGMCVSITYWKQDPYRLVEWLELLKLWGVEEVTVYNQSLAAESDAVFRYYQQKGFVDYRSGEKPMNDGGEYTFFLMMTPVINDCMYRNIHRYKKLVITDFDELIVPRGPSMNNYADMLRQIDTEQPRFCKYKSYWFRNVYFFYNFPPVSETPRYLTTSRYLTRIRHSTYGNSIKSINDPMTCIRVHNHFCWEAIEGYDKQEWHVDVKTHLGMNQHYKKCHLDGLHGDESKGECEKAMKTSYYDDTMLKFKDKIEPHVRKACRDLNLPL